MLFLMGFVVGLKRLAFEPRLWHQSVSESSLFELEIFWGHSKGSLVMWKVHPSFLRAAQSGSVSTYFSAFLQELK